MMKWQPSTQAFSSHSHDLATSYPGSSLSRGRKREDPGYEVDDLQLGAKFRRWWRHDISHHVESNEWEENAWVMKWLFRRLVLASGGPICFFAIWNRCSNGTKTFQSCHFGSHFKRGESPGDEVGGGGKSWARSCFKQGKMDKAEQYQQRTANENAARVRRI